MSPSRLGSTQPRVVWEGSVPPPISCPSQNVPHQVVRWGGAGGQSTRRQEGLCHLAQSRKRSREEAFLLACR